MPALPRIIYHKPNPYDPVTWTKASDEAEVTKSPQTQTEQGPGPQTEILEGTRDQEPANKWTTSTGSLDDVGGPERVCS